MGKRGRKERKEFHNVSIIDTANEGLAIGKCEDGRIIQVKHAVPGDVADVVAVEKRKGMYITKPTFFSTLSEHRTDPFCSHFGVCGGCKWQHMSYDAQLHFKEKSVHDSYRRLGALDTSGILPIVRAPEERYYRNKMEFTASDARWLTEEELKIKDVIYDKDGIGFHLPGSFDKVLDLKHCYLQADPSNAIRLFTKSFCETHEWPFSNLRNKTGFLRNIIVRLNQAGNVMVVLVVGNDNQQWIDMLSKALVERFPEITSLHTCINTKVNDSIHDLSVQHVFGDPTIIETLNHVRFHIGPKSFFQTNSKQAATLYGLTRELAQLKPTDHVLDLYCGVGSLGLYMADQCARVVGIEIIKEAIDDAYENARLNNITNVHFEVGKVEVMLDPNFIARHGKPDVIITDPPRAGMHQDVIPSLIASGASRIVYVSCNPATQARDISLLRDHYELVKAIPVDMFPHTHHVECIALLERK